MHTPRQTHRAALAVATFVAFAAAACTRGDRPSAAGDAADGLRPDSFVAPARGVSSAGARLADTALRRVAPEQRETTAHETDVVIAGSPSGLALTDDAVQPRGGVTSGQVVSGQVVSGQEPPTIIVNEPGAPASTPTPTSPSPSPSTPPKTTPSGTSPGVIARPAPHSPKGAVVRDPRPGTSDTASARPCGAAGTSDTASRSPCGQPGTSDTASAHRRVTVPRRAIPVRTVRP